MIVADKEFSLKKADEISLKLIESFSKEIRELKCEDEPAENIYISIHTVCNFAARIILGLHEYIKSHGVEIMTEDVMKEWIQLVIKENLELLHKLDLIK